MQCARAFGALITMRDDSFDAPIPDEFQPSDYNLKRLEESREKLLELQKMSQEEVERQCVDDYSQAVLERKKYKTIQTLENNRLESMAARVRDWVPPSANHSEMKSFMLDQIRISKHDIDSIDRYSPIKKLTPKEWYDDQLKNVQKDIGYHAAAHEKEVERTKGRTLWIKQLRESLKEIV